MLHFYNIYQVNDNSLQEQAAISAHRIQILPTICNEEVHRQANYATFYVFTWLKVVMFCRLCIAM